MGKTVLIILCYVVNLYCLVNKKLGQLVAGGLNGWMWSSGRKPSEGGEEGRGGQALTHRPLLRGILSLPSTRPKVGADVPWRAASRGLRALVGTEGSLYDLLCQQWWRELWPHYCSWSGPDKTQALTRGQGDQGQFPANLIAPERKSSLRESGCGRIVASRTPT